MAASNRRGGGETTQIGRNTRSRPNEEEHNAQQLPDGNEKVRRRQQQQQQQTETIATSMDVDGSPAKSAQKDEPPRTTLVLPVTPGKVCENGGTDVATCTDFDILSANNPNIVGDQRSEKIPSLPASTKRGEDPPTTTTTTTTTTNTLLSRQNNEEQEQNVKRQQRSETRFSSTASNRSGRDPPPNAVVNAAAAAAEGHPLETRLSPAASDRRGRDPPAARQIIQIHHHEEQQLQQGPTTTGIEEEHQQPRSTVMNIEGQRSQKKPPPTVSNRNDRGDSVPASRYIQNGPDGAEEERHQTSRSTAMNVERQRSQKRVLSPTVSNRNSRGDAPARNTRSRNRQNK